MFNSWRKQQPDGRKQQQQLRRKQHGSNIKLPRWIDKYVSFNCVIIVTFCTT